MKSSAVLIAVLSAAVAWGEDLPPPPSPDASLLVIRHEVTLKDPLDLRPTPTAVDVALLPRGARRVYSDQRVSIYLVAAPGEFQVVTAEAEFRPKRQSGLVGSGRSERPVEKWQLQVHEYEVGQFGLPVAAGTITYGGTLKLVLRRVTENNQSAWGIAPRIVGGEWLGPDPDDIELVNKLIEGTEWQGRKVVRLE